MTALAPSQPCPTCDSWCRIVVTQHATFLCEPEGTGQPVLLTIDQQDQPAAGVLLGRPDLHSIPDNSPVTYRHIC